MPEPATKVATVADTRVSATRACGTSAASLRRLSPSEIRRWVPTGAATVRGVPAHTVSATAPQHGSKAACVLVRARLLTSMGRA
jgi:hypothetical protein